MSDHESQAPVSAESGAAPASARRDTAVERRRKFLVAGLGSVPAIVTLANRPALATGQACTASIQLSATHSIALQGPCGDAPTRWVANSSGSFSSAWKSPYTPSSLFLSIFTGWNSVSNPKASCVHVTNGSLNLVEALKGNLKLRVVLSGTGAGGGNYDSGNGPEFLKQCVATVLNAKLYGSLFPAGMSDTQLISLVASVVNGLVVTGSANSTLKTNIDSALASQISQAQALNKFNP